MLIILSITILCARALHVERIASVMNDSMPQRNDDEEPTPAELRRQAHKCEEIAASCRRHADRLEAQRRSHKKRSKYKPKEETTSEASLKSAKRRSHKKQRAKRRSHKKRNIDESEEETTSEASPQSAKRRSDKKRHIDEPTEETTSESNPQSEDSGEIDENEKESGDPEENNEKERSEQDEPVVRSEQDKPVVVQCDFPKHGDSPDSDCVLVEHEEQANAQQSEAFSSAAEKTSGKPKPPEGAPEPPQAYCKLSPPQYKPPPPPRAAIQTRMGRKPKHVPGATPKDSKPANRGHAVIPPRIQTSPPAAKQQPRSKQHLPAAKQLVKPRFQYLRWLPRTDQPKRSNSGRPVSPKAGPRQRLAQQNQQQSQQEQRGVQGSAVELQLYQAMQRETLQQAFAAASAASAASAAGDFATGKQPRVILPAEVKQVLAAKKQQ